jgi:hypothetical protein
VLDLTDACGRYRKAMMTDSPGTGASPVTHSGAAHVRTLERAAQVPAAWDELTGPGDCYQSTRWMRVAEATAGVPMRYLPHYRGGQLDGALATALAMPSSPWLFGRTDAVLEFAALNGLAGAADCLATLTDGRAVPRTIEEVTSALTNGHAAAPATDLLMPSLLCGGRHINISRVLTRDDGETRNAVLSDLVERAESVASELGARSAAFLYVDEQDAQLRRTLEDRGYLSCLSGLHTILFLPDGGFEAYQAMLPRKRRQSIAHERRKLTAAGLDVQLEPFADDLITSFAGLESQLFAKHGGSWSPEQSAAALNAIKQEFGPDAFAFVGRLDGELCGFALVLHHQDHWYVHRGGFDYARTGDLPVYFEVTYNSVIEAAASSGIKALHHGTGALRAKELRGFSIIKSFLYIKPFPAR